MPCELADFQKSSIRSAQGTEDISFMAVPAGSLAKLPTSSLLRIPMCDGSQKNVTILLGSFVERKYCNVFFILRI